MCLHTLKTVLIRVIRALNKEDTLYPLSYYQNRNRNKSLKFAQINKANSKNIPTIWARSINLSLGFHTKGTARGHHPKPEWVRCS